VKSLLVRLSSIGDVIHTLPAAAALSRAGWETAWAVEPLSAVLLETNPAVSRVFHLPAAKRFRWRDARTALGALRAIRHDAALDFQGLWKSAAWARLSGARRVVGYARPWRREGASTVLIGERVALPEAAVHVIDKNLALLRALGIDAVGQREFPLPIVPGAGEGVARQLGTADGPLVVLNPAGGWASKLWPAEAFGALARALTRDGARVVVTWGPGEETLADQVVAASEKAAVKCFPTTLIELIEVFRRSALVVAADTGPLHLACAVGTPVVGLFGPTDPARNGPFSLADEVVRRVPPCAPCHRRVCSEHQHVMTTLPVDDVLAAARRRLASGREERSVA